MWRRAVSFVIGAQHLLESIGVKVVSLFAGVGGADMGLYAAARDQIRQQGTRPAGLRF